MTIEKVTQVPDRTFDPSTDSITGQRVFEVYTDSAETTEQDILNASDPVTGVSIPAIGSPWNNLYINCVCQGYSLGELDDGFGRSVTVNYSTDYVEEEDPTQDEWQISITEQDRTVDLQQDPISGDNVANTAGDPTPVEVSVSDVVITIKRNIARSSWQDKDIFTYKKSMNQGAVQINGVTYQARQLLMWSIATDATIQVRNGIQFLEQTLTIFALPDAPLIDQNGNQVQEYGWTVSLLNAGLREIIEVGGEAKLVPIADDAGNETTVPWPLDAQGKAIRPGTSSQRYDYIYNTFFLYRETDWSGLNLV